MFNQLKPVFFSVVFLSMVSVLPVQAESACKGMMKSACAEAPACRWINSYKRGDGVEIQGYCRTLPEKKEASGKKS